MNPQQILDFWFKECTPQDWFSKNEAFDRLLEQSFGKLVEQAALGELWTWRESIEGRLAEIILLDQFSRNLWRDTPKAFAQDPMALALAQEAVKLPEYQALPALWRKFVIMPYMHSESALIHEQAVTLFGELNDDYTFDYELRHKAIVDRFGRYPHRNAILGRESSPEELAFLQEEGSSF